MNFRSSYFFIILTIVLYSICMLTYGTLRIFIDEKIDAISAFGSILSGIGTFFAAFAAIYIFNGWKVQANFDLKKEHVNHLTAFLSKGYDELHKISEILINLNDISSCEVLCENYCTIKANDLRVEFYNNIINAKMLDRLNSKNKEIFIYFAQYQNHFIHLVENFNIIQNQYIIYYENHISAMSYIERINFKNQGSNTKYIRKRPRSSSDITLKLLIFNKVKFKKDNICYEYKNLKEMVDKMEIIHNKLEFMVLDSIDLKLN